MFPEFVVPLVEELVVQAVEAAFFIIGQGFVPVCVLCGYAWMPVVFALGVFEEQHVGNEGEQAIADCRPPGLVGLLFHELFYFALGVYFGQQGV